MSENKKKRLAVIGYGGMGGWHVDRALKSDVVELAGIYDIKEERRELARSRGIKAYNSREELLSDPTIDMVTVAVPNDSHEEIIIDALNHGKHALSEKPVTLTMESLERMIAASKKNNRIFSVHQNRRFDVDFLAMKQVHDSGEIGPIINLESRIHGSRGIPSDWRGEKVHGGGMLYDWGVHLIDQALMVLGWDVCRVDCRFDHITNEEVDDGFKLYLDFKSGKTAFIEVGTLNFLPMPRFYMRGRNGTALITDWREKCQIAKCTHWHESEVVPVETAAGLTKTMAPRDSLTLDTYEIERPVSDVHDYYRNFCAAIDGKAEQLVTHDQMRTDLKVILAAFESAKIGAPVTIDCTPSEVAEKTIQVDGKNFALSFEDNFEGNALDTTKWELCPESVRGDIGGSWNNAMTEVHDGNLWLWAKIGENGKPISGAVRTRGLFEQAYGYFEARMCFPKPAGFWCAFWMMCGDVGKVDGTAVSGVEVDIIETGDCAKGGINHALHWDGYGKDLKSDACMAYRPELFDGSWHTFGFAWTKTEYIFFIDGKETWRTSHPGICQYPGYMKLTEEFGNWAAPLVPENLPAACRVDWVRAYRLVD